MILSTPEKMKIHFSNNRLVSEIQGEFNTAFPYLKIEFLKQTSHRTKANYSKNTVAPETKLSEIKEIHTGTDIVFDENISVSDFENTIYELFGINIQVFRRSGNIWLETTMTDNWTLKMQNEHGREITES